MLVTYVWLTAIAFERGPALGLTLVVFFPLAGCIYLWAEANEKVWYPRRLFWIASFLVFSE